MIRAGFEKEEAVDYTIHGCNWPDIPGRYAAVAQIDARLVVNLLDALHSDPPPASMEEFYEATAHHLRRRIREQLQELEPALSALGLP